VGFRAGSLRCVLFWLGLYGFRIRCLVVFVSVGRGFMFLGGCCTVADGILMMLVVLGRTLVTLDRMFCDVGKDFCDVWIGCFVMLVILPRNLVFFARAFCDLGEAFCDIGGPGL